MIARKLLAAGAALAVLSTSVVRAQEVAPNDLLLATLWTQRSVEYKAMRSPCVALAQIRLDKALADKSWTGATVAQRGLRNLPPAVILDVARLVDNSLYQVWMRRTKTLATRPGTSLRRQIRAHPGAVGYKVCGSKREGLLHHHRGVETRRTRAEHAEVASTRAATRLS